MRYIVNFLCDICENGGERDFCKIMLLPLVRIDEFGNNICECGGFVEKNKHE